MGILHIYRKDQVCLCANLKTIFLTFLKRVKFKNSVLFIDFCLLGGNYKKKHHHQKICIECVKKKSCFACA